MLTRRQLRNLSLKQGVALHIIERDYIQTLFLYELYKHTNIFLFKGGTCLRMGYKLNRYSEDLDFNLNEKQDIGIKLMKDTSSRLTDFGIESKLKKEHLSQSGLNYKLVYTGPLFDGTDRSKGTIKIDISCRKEQVDTTNILKLYS
jgi:predicted nucleotidyltransferase component of viral defense system